MKKHYPTLLLIAFVILLLSPSLISLPPVPPIRLNAGTVMIISNGVEHEPYMHAEHAAGPSGSGRGRISVSGAPMQFGRIFEEPLPVVEYADDFQIVIGGTRRGRSVRYSLFDENFEIIDIDGQSMRRVNELLFPDEDGEYILIVHVAWRNLRGDFVSIGHVFRVVK